MSPPEPDEIAARRHPQVVLAVACLRIVAGFCLAFPLGSLVAASGIGLRPEGDRALFEGGGYFLLELLRLQGPVLASALRGLLPLLLLGLVLTCACNVALLVTLDFRDRLVPWAWLARVWARLPAQLVVAAGGTLAQLLLLLVGSAALGAIRESQSRPVATTAAQAASLLVVALLLGAVGGFADVVKAALVRHDARLGDGVGRAFSAAQRSPFKACFGWLPFAALFLLAALGVAKLVEMLDVSRPGAWRIAAVLVFHQLVVVVSVACRAAWFARALRVVASSGRQLVG